MGMLEVIMNELKSMSSRQSLDLTPKESSKYLLRRVIRVRYYNQSHLELHLTTQGASSPAKEQVRKVLVL